MEKIEKNVLWKDNVKDVQFPEVPCSYNLVFTLRIAPKLLCRYKTEISIIKKRYKTEIQNLSIWVETGAYMTLVEYRNIFVLEREI